jgi:RNA polymerase sigma factor (sigma-70 family)
MDFRESASTRIGYYVRHSSFQETGAAQAYGAGPEEGGVVTPSSPMPDEVTRDCSRRMHYAAYRAERARTPQAAAAWRRRYFAWRNRIILGNRKLVYRAVSSRLRGSGATEDLIGECHLVMIRATAAYNPWMGIRFSTYACTCLFRALSRIGRRLVAGWTRPAIDLQTIEDPTLPEEPEGEPDGPPPEWAVVVHHLRDDDSVLCWREKRILEHRFGLSGSCPPSTLDEVGVELGISKERVRQLQRGALGKLREVIRANRAPC